MASTELDYKTYARNFIGVAAAVWLICVCIVAVSTKGFPTPVLILAVASLLALSMAMLGLGKRSPWIAHLVAALVLAAGFCLLMRTPGEPVDVLLLAYSVGFGVLGTAATALLSVAVFAAAPR